MMQWRPTVAQGLTTALAKTMVPSPMVAYSDTTALGWMAVYQFTRNFSLMALRTALLPMRSSPGQPYSRDVETQEVKKLQEARTKIEQQIRLQAQVLKEKEARLAALRAA